MRIFCRKQDNLSRLDCLVFFVTRCGSINALHETLQEGSAAFRGWQARVFWLLTNGCLEKVKIQIHMFCVFWRWLCLTEICSDFSMFNNCHVQKMPALSASLQGTKRSLGQYKRSKQFTKFYWSMDLSWECKWPNPPPNATPQEMRLYLRDNIKPSLFFWLDLKKGGGIWRCWCP